jgi:hypothetical protein
VSTDADIESLVRGFKDGSLPYARWTHQAHLTVALWYLHHHPRTEATRLIRQGIRRYNERHGNTKGYHETITLAWVAVISRFVADRAGESVSAHASALLRECADKDYLLRFYTRPVLMSEDARRTWIPPDRKPIESLGAVASQPT